MKDITKNFTHYLPLIGIMFFAIVGFITFSYDRNFQKLLILVVAALYVVWGIIHHRIHKDLYFTVVLEYIAVAAIGVAIVFSLILNS